MLYTDRGIILKRFPYGEADYLITFMSANYGKFTAIAKGVRKINSRRGGHLDLFNHAEVLFVEGKTLDTVTEVKTLDSFEGIRENLDKIGVAFYVCELLDVLLPKSEKNYSVYKLVVSTFKEIDETRVNKNISKEFSVSLLRDLGYWSDQVYGKDGIDPKLVVESIIERKLKSSNL